MAEGERVLTEKKKRTGERGTTFAAADIIRDLTRLVPENPEVAAARINQWVVLWLCQQNGMIREPEILAWLEHGTPLPETLVQEMPGGDQFQSGGQGLSGTGTSLWQRLAQRLTVTAAAAPAGNLPGDVYENLMSRSFRKGKGQYYTPGTVVDRILADTLALADVVEKPFLRVLDPACGSGHFLLAAYRLLMKKFTVALPELRRRYQQEFYQEKTAGTLTMQSAEAYWQPKNLHRHILTHCLFGAESDSQAGAIAVRALWLQAPRAIPATIDILIADSLLKWENDEEWSVAGPTAQHRPTGETVSRAIYEAGRRFWQRSFDYVIGNPPYISFGLNRVGALNRKRELYYRSEYRHSAEYKINYYALFFERGLSVLANGGRLGYVTPDSFLLGRYFSRLRRYLLEESRILRLMLLSGGVFRGATVGISTISVYEKKSREEAASENTVVANRLEAGGACQEHSYSTACFRRQPYQRFRLYFNSQDQAIVENMEERAGEMCLLKGCIRTGMRGRQGQAGLKGRENKGGNWRPGVISSGQVTPFRVQYQEDWLLVEPELLYAGGWDERIIRRPKILLRQTGDSLIAGIDRAGLYHLNNLHSLSLVPAAPVTLEYLLGVLNSRLLNYYYHVVSLEKGRSMAQTDIETLEKLPIFAGPAALMANIGAVATELEAANPAHDALIVTLRSRLDRWVYQLYGLSATDIDCVEEGER
ncbi:MAG TPA: N-6 DNA methylase [Patescibacteria group bacterium]|nr:N-6 DNA methylase [Patescibacteria group bacterium]